MSPARTLRSFGTAQPSPSQRAVWRVRVSSLQGCLSVCHRARNKARHIILLSVFSSIPFILGQGTYEGVFWLMMSLVAASRVHLSGAAHAALTQFPGYSTEVRGETFVKARPLYSACSLLEHHACNECNVLHRFGASL